MDVQQALDFLSQPAVTRSVKAAVVVLLGLLVSWLIKRKLPLTFLDPTQGPLVRRALTGLVVGLGLSLFLYWLFVHLLAIPLPLGLPGSA